MRQSFLQSLDAQRALMEVPSGPFVTQTILATAGVNKSGKSAIEALFPADQVYGMSETFIPEIVSWWNRLKPEERSYFLEKEGLVVEQWRAYFEGEIAVGMFIPPRPATKELQDAVYEMKDAFGKVIAWYLARARDVAYMGGHPHKVIERTYRRVDGRFGLISGIRTLGDFEYLFCGLGPQVRLHVVYINADERRKDHIRSAQERDMMKIWRLFRDEFPDQFTVIDNNRTLEEFEQKVAHHAPGLLKMAA